MKSFLVYFMLAYSTHVVTCSEDNPKDPTVLLSIISRNEEHMLPTFLAYIENLDYPKKRISILIQTDHNEDDTFTVLSKWMGNVRHMYHRIIMKHEAEPITYSDASGPNDYSEQRYLKLFQLRQNAIEEARVQWADYLLFIDGDNFLFEPDTLRILMAEKKPLIAPMLRILQVEEQSTYSNFWAGVDENGYYRRVPEYFDILNRKKVGSFKVPMIHSTVLIDMNNNATDLIQLSPLPYSYNGLIDDLILFAYSVRQVAGLDFYVCNAVKFGYLLSPSDDLKNLDERKMLFTNAFVDYTSKHLGMPIPRSEHTPYTYPKATYAEFDEIFMINLKRREERYYHMKNTLRELGLKWTYFEAVDGRNLTKAKLDELEVYPMKDFKDEFFKSVYSPRPITHGEVGCFLSHWNIWREIVERKLQTVLVLEDDVRFVYNFRERLTEVMQTANSLTNHPEAEWDFLYIGRKIMRKKEQVVLNTDRILVHPKFSFWTLAYVIRLSGAEKLLAGEPLKKMIPVDDYIPIMFNQHTDEILKKQFSPRNLIALSARELLVQPTHYPNEADHVSDTEDTLSFDDKNVNTNYHEFKEKVTGQKFKSEDDDDSGNSEGHTEL